MGTHGRAGADTKKMIRAVVASIDGIKNDEGEFIKDSKGKKIMGQPPNELVLAWRCSEWRTLPKAGGYYDQPYGLMKRMSFLKRVYSALTDFRNRKGKEIHNMTDNVRRIISLLKDLGYV